MSSSGTSRSRARRHLRGHSIVTRGRSKFGATHGPFDANVDDPVFSDFAVCISYFLFCTEVRQQRTTEYYWARRVKLILSRIYKKFVKEIDKNQYICAVMALANFEIWLTQRKWYTRLHTSNGPQTLKLSFIRRWKIITRPLVGRWTKKWKKFNLVPINVSNKNKCLKWNNITSECPTQKRSSDTLGYVRTLYGKTDSVLTHAYMHGLWGIQV